MLLNAGVIGASAEGGSPLLDGLLAWYSMDEASGNRLDSHTGGYNLTQFGTVGSTTGQIGNSAQFTGNTNNYLRSTNAVFNLGGGSFSSAQWLLPDTSTALIIHGIWNDASPVNNRKWMLYQASQEFRFGVSSDGTGAGFGFIGVGSTYTIGVRYFVQIYYNADTQELGIAVNNQAFNTRSWTTGVYTDGVNDYRIGRGSSDVSPLPWAGTIDEVGIWNRILLPAEWALLYNNSIGIAYPG